MCKLAQFHMFGFGVVNVDWKRADALVAKATELKARDAALWRSCSKDNVLAQALAAVAPFWLKPRQTRETRS